MLYIDNYVVVITILDKIIAFIGQVSLLSFMKLNWNKFSDHSKNVHENFMLRRDFILHTQMRLSRHPRTAIFDWPNYNLQAV